MKYSRGIEDYLEAIYILSENSDNVRIKDVASLLSVKLPSVTEIIQKLAVQGLVQHLPYGKIVLTEKGRAVGKSIWDKHQVIYSFLKDILRVKDNVAFEEACLIEHILSKETLNKLEKFVEEFKLK